jgi:hypothetical protein
VPAARALTVALALTFALAACSDGDEGATASTTASTTSTAPTPTFAGDGSAFCDAMLAIGKVERSADSTPAEVLAANEELLGHLDDAEASAPADAPTDLASLLADYRLAAEAITAADGDVERAFTVLGEESPDVVQRLSSSSSHADAYDFLVDRCGISES